MIDKQLKKLLLAWIVLLEYTGITVYLINVL